MARVFREFRQEVIVQSSMNHPNIVSLKSLSMNPFCLVTEFVPYGNLYNFIHNYDHFIGWDLVIKIALDIANGIKYMHGRNPPIVHIDMKSPNIMLSGITTKYQICAKIADFGTSKFLTGIPLQGRFVDNPVWLAPEILLDRPYGVEVDTYAFGVILWELLTRDNFFGEINFMSDLEDHVIQGKRPPLDICPESFRDVICTCWDNNPSRRPSFNWVISILENLTNQDLSSLEEYRIQKWEALKDEKDKPQKEEREIKERIEKEARKKKGRTI